MSESDKMNVMHVITGLNRGGAEGALLRLVRNDTRNSHCVVSLMDRGVHGPQLEKAGASVHALGMRRGSFDPRAAVGLLRLMRSQRPDVVQTWMYHADLVGGLAARLVGLNAVVWGIRHSNLDPKKTSFSTRVLARACASLSGWVPTAIAICAEEAARVHRAIGYDASKIVVIANGYELGTLKPDPVGRARVRAEQGIAEGEILIGMIARWDPQKDHANFVKALASGPMEHLPVHALLVGTGIEESNADLVALLSENGVQHRVTLLGPRTDVTAILSALDVHVLSSVGEAFPNVVAESMACGTPSIVTDVGDAASIVGDTGWVVPPSDSMALAHGIAAALSAFGDRASWAKRQRANRDRIVEKFPIERMVQAYTELWRATVNSRRSD